MKKSFIFIFNQSVCSFSDLRPKTPFFSNQFFNVKYINESTLGIADFDV